MKSAAAKVIFTVLFVLTAILFTVGMRAFGAAFNRGGVGSRFFLFLVSGPEGLCLLVWPLLAGFLPWCRQPKIALTTVALALIPPIWLTIMLSLEGVQDDVLRSVWKSARPVIYIFGIFYFLPSLIGLLCGMRGAILTLKEFSKAKEETRPRRFR